jgi:uncharacterized iron-regulated membrane protein
MRLEMAVRSAAPLRRPSIVGFLVIVGLTGAALTFEQELDAALDPELFAASHRNQPCLHLDELFARVATAIYRLHIRCLSPVVPERY